MHLWHCIAAIAAGTLIPLQAGINASLRAQIGSPYYATLISVLVSSLSIGVLCLVMRFPVPAMSSMAHCPWWQWIGGIVGVVYIFAVLVLAPKLGATALVASIVAGQLICSLLMDQFGLVGFAQHSMNIGRVAGVILLFAGVVLIQKF
jgi:bacterial/archaeal transporter family-2 protein